MNSTNGRIFDQTAARRRTCLGDVGADRLRTAGRRRRAACFAAGCLRRPSRASAGACDRRGRGPPCDFSLAVSEKISRLRHLIGRWLRVASSAAACGGTRPAARRNPAGNRRPRRTCRRAMSRCRRFVARCLLAGEPGPLRWNQFQSQQLALGLARRRRRQTCRRRPAAARPARLRRRPPAPSTSCSCRNCGT